MTDFDALELPIVKIKIDGPAVRALAGRKEAGDRRGATTAELSDAYQAVKASLLNGLKRLSVSPGA